MEPEARVSPIPTEVEALGTKDGVGTADNDRAYDFGRLPNARAPFPFNERQFARLLILRGLTQDAPSPDDRSAA